MKIFHEVDPWDLERSELHLWGLALGTIFAFIVAIAFLVYPSVFLQPVTLGGGTVRSLFVGFCVLAGLLFGYLLERYALIIRLRRQLKEEKRKAKLLQQGVTASLLDSLPGFKQFQSRVAWEYRRVVIEHQSLSILVAVLSLRKNLAKATDSTEVIEKAAHALIRKLRGEDSVYLIGPANFCVVLPEVHLETARVICGRVTEGLRDASGFGLRFSFEIKTLNYPENVLSEEEIDAIVRPYVDKQEAELMIDDDSVPAPRDQANPGP
jgi:hypothetical protein